MEFVHVVKFLLLSMVCPSHAFNYISKTHTIFTQFADEDGNFGSRSNAYLHNNYRSFGKNNQLKLPVSTI